jgi:hypothetical protein
MTANLFHIILPSIDAALLSEVLEYVGNERTPPRKQFWGTQTAQYRGCSPAGHGEASP